MDRAQIQAEWDKFIEYPSDDKRIVTTTSALLFAEHIAKLQATQEPVQAGEVVRDAVRSAHAVLLNLGQQELILSYVTEADAKRAFSAIDAACQREGTA